MKLRAVQKDEEEAGVQMAPLIDCVFILLIFFLVTSLLQKPHKELPVKVPSAGAGDAVVPEQDALVVTLTAVNPDLDPKAQAQRKAGVPVYDPFIVLDDEPVTKDLLNGRLRQVARENIKRRVRIDCEGRLAWRHVVPILDMCREHGLSAVSVRTF